MDKGQQFMLMVQTGLILYYMKRDDFRNTACMTWGIDHLADAVNVMSSIPAEVSAAEAADHFLKWALRTEAYVPSECPAWLLEPA